MGLEFPYVIQWVVAVIHKFQSPYSLRVYKVWLARNHVFSVVKFELN